MEKVNPIILIDTREQTPLRFENYRSEPATLTTGDYSIKGMESSFSIERKSVPDLIGSLTQGRERFTRELERLRGYNFKRLLIIGSIDQIRDGDYRSRATPAAILGSLNAFEIRFNVPVVFTPTPEEGAKQIERWAFYAFRERVKDAEKFIQETSAKLNHC